MSEQGEPSLDMISKIKEGANALRAAREALSDLDFILETLIEDIEFALRSFEMDRKWNQVMP